MPDRIYCALSELLEETQVNGFQSEAVAMRFLRSASDFIDRRLGNFIPLTQTRTFNGNDEVNLFIDPLTTFTTVSNNGTTLGVADYLGYPLNKHWLNGPYTRVCVGELATLLSTWYLGRGTVSITGRWGKYEENVSTGATLGAALADTTGTTLLASSGALVSPGMVLLVDSEQILVEATSAATDSTANTAEAVDTSEEEIDLNDASFVNVGEIIRVDFEQMKILDKKTNTLLVVRGWNNTTRTTHTTSTDVYVYRTFTIKRGVNGTTAATHLISTALNRYVAPPEIRYLITATAVLRMEKARAKFAGRQGNPELGEVFYFSDFPKTEFEQCQKMFRVQTL